MELKERLLIVNGIISWSGFVFMRMPQIQRTIKTLSLIKIDELSKIKWIQWPHVNQIRWLFFNFSPFSMVGCFLFSLVSILDIKWWWEFRQKSCGGQVIKSEIIAHLACRKARHKICYALPNTKLEVQYDNGGDVEWDITMYYFTAYVDHNRERTMCSFPCQYLPFTLFLPTL